MCSACTGSACQSCGMCEHCAELICYCGQTCTSCEMCIRDRGYMWELYAPDGTFLEKSFPVGERETLCQLCGDFCIFEDVYKRQDQNAELQSGCIRLRKTLCQSLREGGPGRGGDDPGAGRCL